MSRCTAAQFTEAIDDDRRNRFARTFVAKARTQRLWPGAFGAWQGEKLAGALCWTLARRTPVANLQLLHTFARFRLMGVGRLLCEEFLIRAQAGGAEYFRVSAEPEAVEFYRRIGVRFLGQQKSGCLLSVGQLPPPPPTFNRCIYSHKLEIAKKAVYKKGKGGCIIVFEEPA